jgi:hypothetical protein
MTQREFIERKEKIEKMPTLYRFFFSIRLCFSILIKRYCSRISVQNQCAAVY